jgi:hypothetical protein
MSKYAVCIHGFYLSFLVPDFYKLHACCYCNVVSNTQYVGGRQGGIILVSVTLIYMYRFTSQYRSCLFWWEFWYQVVRQMKSIYF